MSEKNLRDHLVGFYAGQSLPSDKAAWLRTLAQVDTAGAPGPGLGHGVGRLSKMLYGLAACAAVLLLATAYYVSQDRRAPDGLADKRRSSGADDTTQSASVGATAFPKLVVVKVHADWCARSPMIAPIFTELTEKYGNQPVLFVTFDITDEKKRRQARYLASSLGIGWVHDESFESGTIMLIDREKSEFLAILTDLEEVPRMENALASALPRQP